MLLISICIYIWGGFTCVFQLWQFEDIGLAVNGLDNEMGNKSHIRPVLHEKPFYLLVMMLIWPIILPYQVFTAIKSQPTTNHQPTI